MAYVGEAKVIAGKSAAYPPRESKFNRSVEPI